MYNYYSQYRVHTATPSPRGSPKTHARRATQDFAASSRPQYYPAGFPSSRFHAAPQEPEPRDPDYVSGWSDYMRSKARRFHAPGNAYYRSDSKHHRHQSSRPQFYECNDADDEYGYYQSQYYDAPPPYEAYHRSQRYWYNTDHKPYYDQVPIFTPADGTEQPAHRPRRRASTAARPEPTPQKTRPSTSAKPSRKATEEDARRAGIPAGYSYKNWDPTEEPITLLGSVFDANSLGKWVYDWTVFHYGPATPMSEVAGELWLLLIQLAGKVKRADHMMPKIRKEENREMVEEFIDSGERLWIRVKKLLRLCEEYMWKAAKRDTGEKKPVKMGHNSGCEFVDSIFGRDRELEKTEKLMTAIRLWSMRFDANCDEILKNPSA